MNCNICLEEYDPIERIPKILPCGHTYCLPCITSMSSKATLARTCPMCQKPLGEYEPTALRTNLALISSPSVASKDLSPLRKARPIPTGLICAEHNEEFNHSCECAGILCSVCVDKYHLGHHNRGLLEEEQRKIAMLKKTTLSSLWKDAEQTFANAEEIIRLKQSIFQNVERCKAEAKEEDVAWLHAMKVAAEKEVDKFKQGIIDKYTKTFECLKILEGDLPLLKEAVTKLKEFEADGINPDGTISAESLERNIDRYFELQQIVLLTKKCMKAITQLKHYQSSAYQPISLADIEAYRNKTLQPIKQKLYIRMGECIQNPLKVLPVEISKTRLSCAKLIHVGWNNTTAYCLQGLVLYKYDFVSSTWEKELLQLCTDSTEYEELSEIELVLKNQFYIYIIGGFHDSTKAYSASCFCICKGRICRISSLHRAKSMVIGAYTNNFVYAIGGKTQAKNLENMVEICSDIEQYSCSINVWQVVSLRLDSPRYSGIAFVQGPRLLIVGGYSKINEFCTTFDLIMLDSENGKFTKEFLPNTLKLPYEPLRFGATLKDSLLFLIFDKADVPIKEIKNKEYFIMGFTDKGECVQIEKMGRIRVGIGRVIPEHDGLFYNFVIEPGINENEDAKLRAVVYNTKGKLEKRPDINKGLIETLLLDTAKKENEGEN